MFTLLTPRWWSVGTKPVRRPSVGRIVRWRLRPALHPRVTAHIPLSSIVSNNLLAASNTSNVMVEQFPPSVDHHVMWVQV